MVKPSKNKVFVLGLDGATFNLIRPWVESMELPNFAKLINQGCHGDLESVIPPLTAPAWASFITGKNPGKHGVFDFVERKPGSYDIEWVTSLSRRGRSLWKIVSSHEGNVVVINIPNNYPLEQVSGCMVAWMDAPGDKKDYTYPPELANEIKENIGDYIITILDWKENEDLIKFRYNLHRMIDKRAELTYYLMEHKPWDFFTVLFTATDIVQHCFWSYMDPSHPLYSNSGAKNFGDTIKEIYHHIDKVLGEIQARLSEDTTLIVMSDHGAGPLRSAVHLNKWLEEKGWLTFSSHSSRSISRAALYKTLSFLKRYLSPSMRSTLKRLLPGMRDKIEGILFSSLLDLRKTKAYSLGSYGNIYINLKNRETEGIVNEGKEYEALRDSIASRLMDLKDPITKEKVVKKVFKREDIYKGSFVSRAPDLIVHWSDAGYHSVQRFGKSEDSVFSNRLDFHLTKLRFTGCHRLEGIFAIKGKSIRVNASIRDAKIIDIAPTVLYLMGLPIPKDMDGRVLKDAFLPQYLTENPIQFEEESKEDEGSSTIFEGYSKEESEKIAERLKNLGYIE
jgi:predicted AlkP superfamily phosphohydrolase/phosphomutase